MANNARALTRATEEVADFCTRFTLEESARIFHKMVRAAFAKKEVLDKEGIRDVLYLKEQLEKQC